MGILLCGARRAGMGLSEAGLVSQIDERLLSQKLPRPMIDVVHLATRGSWVGCPCGAKSGRRDSHDDGFLVEFVMSENPNYFAGGSCLD